MLRAHDTHNCAARHTKGEFSPTHILIVLAIVFFLFGAKRLPELAKATGTSIREFKRGIKDIDEELEVADEEKPAAAASSAQPSPVTLSPSVVEASEE